MNSVLLAYVLLGFAIVSEVIGSSFLVKSEGFTKLFPSVMVFIFLARHFIYYHKLLKQSL
jgi:small multidrug resistance pump